MTDKKTELLKPKRQLKLKERFVQQLQLVSFRLKNTPLHASDLTFSFDVGYFDETIQHAKAYTAWCDSYGGEALGLSAYETAALWLSHTSTPSLPRPTSAPPTIVSQTYEVLLPSDESALLRDLMQTSFAFSSIQCPIQRLSIVRDMLVSVSRIDLNNANIKLDDLLC